MSHRLRVALRRIHRGFSLIELAVVLIVIGVIAAIAIPTFQTVVERAEDRAVVASQEALGRQVLALVAFGDTYEEALLASLEDLGAAAAPGVWAAAPWDPVDEADAEGPIVEGELRYVDAVVRLGWVVKHKESATVACLVEAATVECWVAERHMTAASALEGAPRPGVPVPSTTVPPPPSVAWAANIPVSTAVHPADVSVTSGGDTYVTGLLAGTATFGDTTLVPVPGGFSPSDVFVAKLGVDGEWLWAISVGNEGAEEGVDVAATADGGAVVTGFYNGAISFGDHTLSGTSTRGFVAKVSSAGVWEWARDLGVGRGGGVAVTESGEVFVAAHFSGTATLRTSPQLRVTSAGASDVLVAKLSHDGEWLWAARAGGSSTDQAVDIAASSDGGAVVTGVFRSTASYGSVAELTATNTQPEVFVAKVDSSGNWVWAAQAAGTGQDAAAGVAVTSNGDAVVVGQFRRTVEFGSTELTSATTSSPDMFVAKVDSSGNWVWALSAGGTGWDEGLGVAATPDGGVAVAGFFAASATVGEFAMSGPGQEVLVAKVDSAGNWVWATSGGGWAGDRARGVAVTHDGFIRAAGYYSSQATFGSTELTTTSGADGGFVVTLTPSGSFG